MAASATSNFVELQAAPDWKRIDFISDLHLSSATPRTLDAFAGYLSAVPADAVVILGDLFDAWVGDDARHEGIERQVAEMLTRASRRLGIYFLVGNRDFLLGSDMLGECGVEPLDDPTVLVAFGQRALLTHGDSLCLADHGYQKFRALVRQPGWQREFLRRPLDVRRDEARRLRGESHAAQNQPDSVDSPATDLDPSAMDEWLRCERCRSVDPRSYASPAKRTPGWWPLASRAFGLGLRLPRSAGARRGTELGTGRPVSATTGIGTGAGLKRNPAP